MAVSKPQIWVNAAEKCRKFFRHLILDSQVAFQKSHAAIIRECSLWTYVERNIRNHPDTAQIKVAESSCGY